MKKNVLIVNYNTQNLTDACIRSVNKTTPGCMIYVFDNSDKEPFKNTFTNVTIFDNTKGQIIDFCEWLKKYPNNVKSGEATKIRGSAKHCYTVERCLYLIGGGFVLLDSDVLVKKDFSNLYDDKLIYVGDVEKQAKTTIKRVLPFICYINSDMCTQNNVHFFESDKMHGLYNTQKGESYDTGAAFYLSSLNFPHKEIKYEDYVVHLKGGSWFDTNKKYMKKVHKKEITVTPEEWLEKYRYLWEEDKEQKNDKSEPEKPKPAPEEKVMPVEKKKEAEVKYLKMAKTSDRKIGVLNR